MEAEIARQYNGLAHLGGLAGLGVLLWKVSDSWVTLGCTSQWQCKYCGSRFVDAEHGADCCKCEHCGEEGRDYEVSGCPDCSTCDGCSELNDDCTCCSGCGENTADYSYCDGCDRSSCCCDCDCGGCSYCHSCGGHHCQVGSWCDNCDEYQCECGCENIDEHELAREMGLKPHLDLAQQAANYYLLLNMWQRFKEPRAYELLGELAEKLVPEFEVYLDMACGGELRHAPGPVPAQFTPPVLGGGTSRGLAMKEWLGWGTPLQRAVAAEYVFRMDMWGSGGSYGGEKWADIAMTLKMRRVPNPLDPIKWLDRVWNLQHNGGCALNKIYSCGVLQREVLPAHGDDDYDKMLSYASQEVRELWYETRDWRRLYDDYAYRVRAGLELANDEQYHAPLQVVISEFRPKRRQKMEWSDSAGDYIEIDNHTDLIDHWTNTKAFKTWATTTGG